MRLVSLAALLLLIACGPPPRHQERWVEVEANVCRAYDRQPPHQDVCTMMCTQLSGQEDGGCAEGGMVNLCQAPPEWTLVACPDGILPTQPPATTVIRDHGTCWVDCDGATCAQSGPLRVQCPDLGEPAPNLTRSLVVPALAKAQTPEGMVVRTEEFRCELLPTYVSVACPAEIIPRVADGVVAIATANGCYFGTIPVACPEARRTWR